MVFHGFLTIYFSFHSRPRAVTWIVRPGVQHDIHWAPGSPNNYPFKNVTFQVLQIKLFNTSIHLNFVPLFLCQPTGFCIHKILPKKEKKHSGWVLKKNLICLHFDAFPQRIWEGYNVEIILFIIITCISFFILFFKRTFESANSSCKFVVIFRFSASFDPNQWIKITKSWGMSLPFNSKDLIVNSSLKLLHIAL